MVSDILLRIRCRSLEVRWECGLQKWFVDLRRRNEGRKERSLYRLMMHEIHLYIRLCGVGHIVKNQM